ncbi:MAG: hypothetical protein WED10_08250 [Brumimicrobium sp.]
MKLSDNITAISVCFLGFFTLVSNNVFAQGNGNGNGNSNNANGNALKWDKHGNQADTTDFIGTTNPTALKLRTDNTERMRITKDGRIGVGVLTPLERLELDGNLKLSGDIIFSDYVDTTDKFLFVDENGRTFTKSLKSIKGSIYTPIFEDCELDKNGDVAEPVWHNGLNKIYNNCPINIGIRTVNPLYTLDVRGQIRGTRNIFLGIPVGTPSEQFDELARVHVINANSIANTNNKGDFVRFDDFSGSYGGNKLKTIFKIDEKGGINLGYIGQEAPLIIKADGEEILQLENDGLLRSRKIRIDLDNWSDFVFEDDYQLMPLGELSTFVQANKHLPNVPSEKKLQEDGLDLAEMNKILMQKIEELTLYMIEQNEKTEKLQEEIKELKEQMAE